MNPPVLRALVALALPCFAVPPARAFTPTDPRVPACAAAATREALPESDLLRCVDQSVAASRRAPESVSADALIDLAAEEITRSIRVSDPVHIAAVDALAAELRRRREDSDLMHAMPVWARQLNGRFADAGALQDARKTLYTTHFPRLVPAAAGLHPGGPIAWSWNVAADTLTEKAVDLAHGARLVVMSAPNCHFCVQAATDIETDPALAKAFADNAVWTIRPFSGLAADAMREWMGAHPAMPMSVILDPAGWPIPARYGTPYFVFMRDGRVVKEIFGWQPHAEQTMREGFAAIGIEVAR